jgi:hypothetical protein
MRLARLAPGAPDSPLPDRVARGATLVWWEGAGRSAIVGCEPPLNEERKDTSPMSHRRITILAAGAALAALAPASAAVAGSAPASGVPAGRIELTVRSVHVTGSRAVPRYERSRQYLTADQSHTVTISVPQHKLRFEGFTSPRRDLRWDAATNRITSSKGSATPPYQTVAQEAAGFARQVAQGCWTPAGNLVFEGRGSTRYNLVAAKSGPCRGDAQVGQAIVDRRTGAVLRREVGRADGSVKEVDVLSQFQTLALTARTRGLLKFGSHDGGRLAGRVGRSF